MRLREGLLYFAIVTFCDAYKILLVFPIPSRSHSILGEGFVKILARAGHEITYVTPIPMKNPPSRVRQVDVSENKKFMPVDQIFDARLLVNKEIDLQNAADLVKVCIGFANETIHIDSFQKLVNDPTEQFDAVIVEWLYTEMFSGLAAVFNCPLIWSSSMDHHSLVLRLIDDYLNPSYSIHHLSRNYSFDFWERICQLWMTVRDHFSQWTLKSFENDVYKIMYEKVVAKRGRQLPPYEEVKFNASLMFGNSYISTSAADSLPQNYKAIGGYHIEKEIQPLPKDLQKMLDDAKHGFIYFSMGSVLKSSRIPERLKRDILEVFRSLNQTVIWKLEELMTDIPPNVHILPWVPQTSILAHPNCVLFITHGGLLSKLEALHFGVPIIGMPLYGDQFVNIERAVINGFGKRVDLDHNGARNLEVAIREILIYPSYKQRIKEYSFIHHHRVIQPDQELVHWVEHVIKTRGALHLRSPALHVPWYQKYYLDLAAVLLIIFMIVLKLCKHARIIARRYFKDKLS